MQGEIRHCPQAAQNLSMLEKAIVPLISKTLPQPQNRPSQTITKPTAIAQHPLILKPYRRNSIWSDLKICG